MALTDRVRLVVCKLEGAPQMPLPANAGAMFVWLFVIFVRLFVLSFFVF